MCSYTYSDINIVDINAALVFFLLGVDKNLVPEPTDKMEKARPGHLGSGISSPEIGESRYKKWETSIGSVTTRCGCN